MVCSQPMFLRPLRQACTIRWRRAFAAAVCARTKTKMPSRSRFGLSHLGHCSGWIGRIRSRSRLEGVQRVKFDLCGTGAHVVWQAWQRVRGTHGSVFVARWLE